MYDIYIPLERGQSAGESTIFRSRWSRPIRIGLPLCNAPRSPALPFWIVIHTTIFRLIRGRGLAGLSQHMKTLRILIAGFALPRVALFFCPVLISVVGIIIRGRYACNCCESRCSTASDTDWTGERTKPFSSLALQALSYCRQ